MKKLLSIILAAMLLPLAASALSLEPNQRIMGHYTTDDIELTNGWGKSFLTGVNPIATDITYEELAVFQGSKIVAFRVGLAESAPVTRVFVMPLGTNGKPTGEITEWECSVSDKGWNLIELESPYEINLPDGCGLRIGFDYEQLTKDSKPISAVKVGTTYPSYILRGSNWINYGVNTMGNLSLQCITENDNYPQYIMRASDFTCRKNIKVGDDLGFSFKIRNLGAGEIAPGDLTFNVAIDGTVIKDFSNPDAVGFDMTSIIESVTTMGLATADHTVSVTLTALKGQPVDNPITMTGTFHTFENGYSRQMRLVEQFTSTGCTYCPQGTANIQGLCDMRNDIAWVSIHENMGNTDPFRTLQTDSITNLQGIDGFPEGSFDRTVGIEADNHVYAVLTVLSPTQMSTFLDYVAELPSWATVNVNSTFDAATRQAVITIDGDLVPDFDEIMGSDSKLTVYITEDGLVAPQVSGGNDYVHNNVLRQALVSVKGVNIKRTGNTYKNEFTVNIPTAWNADNLNIVAFISRPLRNNALTDIYVTNANKRKLGESDEAPYVIGDVDGNQAVTIDDLSKLIDLLLNGTDNANPGADCDQNGEITIDDVAALIDMLLKAD